MPASLSRVPLIVPALLSAGLAVLAALPPAAVAEGPPVAPHEQIRRSLLLHDAVIPRRPDVAPVHLLRNREAIVPPQCYTRTEGTFNPCYVCHQSPIPGRENVMDDFDLQEAYTFSDVGLSNHWTNLFEDRSARVAAMPDDEILRWVREDNYSELAGRLRAAGFRGWIPDLSGLQDGAAAFDERGLARDGSNWVAFNYKPFPSTFWPTNGSADDVMIRLPARFRTDASGKESPDAYFANLAIVEAKIKGRSAVSCVPLDEALVGEDLDGDGRLGVVRRITRTDRYAGGASAELCDSHLFPEGTEFLHTLRYLDVGEGGRVAAARRMKEVRYMRKVKAYRKAVYSREYQLDGFDKEQGNLPRYASLGDHGLDNGTGWSISGFIEGPSGRLRALTHEENMSCMGCHGSIGSTIDKTFSMARKVDGAAGWRYIDLAGMPDAPSRGETRGELLTYFERAGGGDEFRSNEEMLARWFTPDGRVDERKVRAADVAELVTPSAARALALNKAYRAIVLEQDYLYGKDATVTPPRNVYAAVDPQTAPVLPAGRTYAYDIVLDWTTPAR